MPTRGDVTEGAILGEFTKLGLDVLIPWRHDLPYDLVVDTGTAFIRVQCKSGRVRGSRLEFNSRATDHGSGHRHYRGRADLFAIYCPELDACFAVPVDDAATSITSFRLVPARNNQVRRTRLATDHTIECWARALGRPSLTRSS